MSGGAAHGASYTVDDPGDPGTNDDALCTLREALSLVNGTSVNRDCVNTSADPPGTNDTIGFVRAFERATLTLNAGPLVFDADVAIHGPNPGTPGGLVIDAAGASRLAELTGSSSASVLLDSLSLINGTTADAGGAILVDTFGQAELTLANCVISGSSADDRGGAIHVAAGNAVVLDHCTVQDNTAGMDGSAVAMTSGSLSISDSTITNNQALMGDGAVFARINNFGADVSIERSTVGFNAAPSDSSGGVFFQGGTGDHLSIVDSTIRDNGGRGVSVFGANLDVQGSVISNHASAATEGAGVFLVGANAVFADSIIRGNQASTNGGGISVSGATSTLALRGTTVANNSARQGGGLSLAAQSVEIHDSSISNNSATSSGGGIRASGGTLTLENSVVHGNHSNGFAGGMSVSSSSDVVVSGSTFSANSANSVGGGIFVSGELALSYSTVSGNTAREGGGVSLGSNAEMDMRFSTLADNSATLLGSNLHVGSDVGVIKISGSLIARGQGRDNCEFEPGAMLPITSTSLSDDASCTGLSEDAAAGSRLGLLGDNGGPTLTHALFSGNPAIDTGGMTCASTDQRGFAKPVVGVDGGDPSCDVGAVEFVDSDFDGLIDIFETRHGLDPLDPEGINGSEGDLDKDGVSNLQEFESGLAANNPDSDGDVLGDAIDLDPANDSNACTPDFSGPEGAMQFDATASAAMTTQCASQSQITIRSTALVEAPNAALELYAPTVIFDPDVAVPLGPQLQIKSVDPVPGSAP